MHPIAAAVLAALAGFAEMTLELTAVRLFAPSFGDSAPVWTNVIGVMLAAMALGAWIGGRLADPRAGRARLARLLTVAAVFAVAVPWVAPSVASWLLPEGLMLDRAMGVLVRGSLGATLLLFAPPVLLAGAVTPLLVTTLAHGPLGVGRASGLVATWSILGGLAGTFLTTHLLVPSLGSRASVWIAATGLGIAAAIAWNRPRGGAAAVAALGGVLVLLPTGPLRQPAEGLRLLAERESTYQFLQVVRDAGGDPPATLLKINEGLDSFHSVRIDGTPWTGGRYYDWHVIAPWLASDGRPIPAPRVLSLGAAAGTFERVFHAVHEGVQFESVELDPTVVALGREYFGAYADDDTVFAGIDARVFVDHVERVYDVILVDCYERQIYVPAHVASVEFFGAIQKRLAPGGVVSVNVGALGPRDPVLTTIATTMARVFGAARALRVPNSRNYVVVARRGEALDPTALGRVESADPALLEVLELAERDDAWHRFADDPAATVLRDDRPFLDAMQERSYGGAGSPPEPIRPAGDLSASEAERLAREREAFRDQDGVLAALAQSRAATPDLRRLAGDARWSVGDFAGAAEEYRAGLALESPDATRAVLEARLAAVADWTARDADVAAAAGRASLVALGAAVLLLVAATIARAVLGRVGAADPGRSS